MPVKFFRPPFGARRPAVFRIAREMGLTPVLWNAMTSDWSEPSAERIAEQLAKTIEGSGGADTRRTSCCTTADIATRRRIASLQ